MNKDFANKNDDKKCAAVCGLFCEACIVYIGSTEEPERLESLAEQLNTSVEELRCYGCRSEKVSSFCADCRFVGCAGEKEVDFCAECAEFPCDELQDFQSAKAHRIELWSDSEAIKKCGYSKWMVEARSKYSCPECGTINSAYDLQCRKCGRDPSNEYVEKHRDAIMKYIQQR